MRTPFKCVHHPYVLWVFGIFEIDYLVKVASLYLIFLNETCWQDSLKLIFLLPFNLITSMIVIENWPLCGAGEHGAAISSHRHCPGSTSLGNWGHVLLHTNLEVCASTWISQLLQFRCLQVKELAKSIDKKDFYLSDASTCDHQANGSSGWNSSPPSKWCG